MGKAAVAVNGQTMYVSREKYVGPAEHRRARSVALFVSCSLLSLLISSFA